MARPLSIDLRTRIVSLAEAGHTIRAVAARFDVAPSTVSNLVRHLRRTGGLEPRRTGPRRGHRFDRHRDWLLDQIRRQPDQTMPELAARLLVTHDMKAAPAELSRWLIRQGYSYKKNADGQRTRKSTDRTAEAGMAE